MSYSGDRQFRNYAIIRSRMNIQTRLITGFVLALDKPIIVLSNGANRAPGNPILKSSSILNEMQIVWKALGVRCF